MFHILMVAASLSAQPAEPAIDASTARTLFDEYEALCQSDGGALWGTSLCGRMMLVDPATRIAYFNSAPPVDHRRLADTLFQGRFPDDLVLANTSFVWEGERWLQLIEFPPDASERRALAIHESFHGVQDRLGFEPVETVSHHLEEELARYWIRLEIEALAAALGSPDERWRTHLSDAMRFNRRRAIAFPGAREVEAAMINHEGLAEYTGVRIGGGDRAGEMALQRLKSAAERTSLVRTVGYVLGPAYGMLLDRSGIDWKEAALSGVAMPLLLEAALDPADTRDAARGRYDTARIASEERARAQRRQARLAELRTRFVEGPVLRLPLVEMNISFDPDRVTTLEEVGTIRSGASVTDRWGRLTVEGDVLIAEDWSYLAVPLSSPPSGRSIAGEGWTLDLSEAWQWVPGEREGDWIARASQ